MKIQSQKNKNEMIIRRILSHENDIQRFRIIIIHPISIPPGDLDPYSIQYKVDLNCEQLLH
jgi:hypothetical protein